MCKNFYKRGANKRGPCRFRKLRNNDDSGGERGGRVKGEIIKSKRTRAAFVPFSFFFFFSSSFFYRLAPRGRYRCRFNPFPSGPLIYAWLFFMPVSPRRELLSIDPDVLTWNYGTIARSTCNFEQTEQKKSLS